MCLGGQTAGQAVGAGLHGLDEDREVGAGGRARLGAAWATWPGHPGRSQAITAYLRRNHLGQQPGVGCTAPHAGDSEWGTHLVSSWPEGRTW